MRVIRSFDARCAIELDRSAAGARLLSLNVSDNFVGVATNNWPETWAEIIPEVGRVERSYDRWWLPLELDLGTPYPIERAARRYLHPVIGSNQYTEDALEVLVSILPPGNFHLFAEGHGFVGRYETADDAQALARAMRSRAIVIASPNDIKLLPPVDLQYVLDELGMSTDTPKHPSFKEIFSMATKAKKKTKQQTAGPIVTQLTKGAKTKVKVGEKRTDGPVAKAWAIFDKMNAAGKASDTPAIKEACAKAGINPGTTGVQLGRWRKENGIVKAVTKAAKVKADKPATKPTKPIKTAAQTFADPLPAPVAAKGPKTKKPVSAKKPASKPSPKRKPKGKSTAAKPTPVVNSGPTPSPDPTDADTSADNASTLVDAANANLDPDPDLPGDIDTDVEDADIRALAERDVDAGL